MRGAPDDGRPPRVLSIQSHVVSGYVGNKCAVLPLQVLGFNVDPVNSVQFSNHTGYPVFRSGGVPALGGTQLADILGGLRENGLLADYTHMLTGYIGSVSLLEQAVAVAQELRASCSRDTSFEYLCDPVMGDDGRLYVSSDLVATYRDKAVPSASIMTPNQFEAELLTGVQITSLASAQQACDALHARGPHTVVITSMTIASGSGGDELVVFASTRQPQSPGKPQRCTVRFPKIPAYFTGTGDFFSALLLAWLHNLPGDMIGALTRAVATLQAAVRDTAARAGQAASATTRTAPVCQARELRLVENISAVLSPPMDSLVPPLIVTELP